MKVPDWFLRRGYYIGPIAAIYAWVVILICARLNPWWVWTRLALSYMGDPTLTSYAWVYDYVAMVPVGLLFVAFSAYLIAISRNRTEVAGSLSLTLSGVLVTLIGIFHQTPGPLEIYHEVFSLWFFLQALLSLFIWGVGLYQEGRGHLGLGLISVTLATLVLDAVISAAFGTPSVPASWAIWGAFLLAFGLFAFAVGTYATLGGTRGLFGRGLGLVSLVGGFAFFLLFSGLLHLGTTGTLPRTLGDAIGSILLLTGVLLFAAHILAPTSSRKALAGALLGFFGVFLGSLSAFVGILAVFGGAPGATGEVLGILAIDAGVVFLFFGKDATPRQFPATVSEGVLAPGEIVKVSARPALWQVLQIRAMAYALTGLFLFGYAYYYLSSNLLNLVLAKDYRVANIWGTTLSYKVEIIVVTLVLYLVGYLLVLMGAARWRNVLSPWTFRVLFSLTVVVPLVFLATWFYPLGNEVLLIYLFLVALAIPLSLALRAWLQTRFAISGDRVFSVKNNRPGTARSVPLSGSLSVGVRQSWVQRHQFTGDIVFFRDVHHPPEGFPEPDSPLVWSEVEHPHRIVQKLREDFGFTVGTPPARRRSPQRFLVAFTIVTILVLLLTMVPVYSVTEDLNVPCAAAYANGASVLSDPWPFVHNVTIAPGKVTFHWWSGTPVWLIMVQLPVGISYQDTNISSLLPGYQQNLSEGGSGAFSSYGGSSFVACAGTSEGTTVTLVLTLNAPLVWE